MAFPSPTKTYHQKTYEAISPARPELSTKGKNAFISGGGTGIGASIAHSLARSGVTNLGILGRRTSPLEATKTAIEAAHPGTKVHLYAADITDAEATAKTLAAFAQAAGGAIDILVANAGYLSDLASIADTDPEEWWQGFEVSVRGNFNLLRAFRPLAAAEGASVIHISTAAVHLPYMPGFSSYRASKIAATKMFEYFRHENPGVFVLQVHPGLVRTPMADKFAPAADEMGLVFDDVALPGDFVMWALSGEARFLDGRFVHANWDVEELMAMRGELEKDEGRFTLGLLGWY